MNVLVLGGLGFIGSNIVNFFAKDKKNNVVVIDGLMNATGGDKEHVVEKYNVKVYIQRIEEMPNLDDLLKEMDLVIDSIGWTSHLEAFTLPLYDLELNVTSHLYLIEKLRKHSHLKVIYLGSRGQYGNPTESSITEATAQCPVDIQGIHKVATESHFRILADHHNISVASIRFGNTFGPNQKVTGNDIGLIGGFIRDLISGKTVRVFGEDRSRNIVSVDQLINVIEHLSTKEWSKFQAFNLAGTNITIYKLAKAIQEIVNSGEVVLQEIENEVKLIDTGMSSFSDGKLTAFLGPNAMKDNSTLEDSLKETIEYFQGKLCANL